MTIFYEHFPIEKSIVQKYLDRKQNLEEIAIELCKPDNEPQESSKLIKKSSKLSMTESIAEIKRETDESLLILKEMDEKSQEIHTALENFDNMNYFDEPNIEESKDEESIDLSSSTATDLRVFQFEDTAPEVSTFKAPKIKSTRASILKSKFTKDKNSIAKSQSVQKIPESTAVKPFSSSFTFEKPKAIRRSQTVSSSVRKMLDDAKEKFKSNQEKKTNIEVNVVDLQMF